MWQKSRCSILFHLLSDQKPEPIKRSDTLSFISSGAACRRQSQGALMIMSTATPMATTPSSAFATRATRPPSNPPAHACAEDSSGPGRDQVRSYERRQRAPPWPHRGGGPRTESEQWREEAEGTRTERDPEDATRGDRTTSTSPRPLGSKPAGRWKVDSLEQDESSKQQEHHHDPRSDAPQVAEDSSRGEADPGDDDETDRHASGHPHSPTQRASCW